MPLSGYSVIFGGSFDPPHVGHQSICFWLAEALHADKIIVAPTYEHCFGKDLTEFKHRIFMCRVMANPIPKCMVTHTERLMPRPNYTVNLVKHYTSVIPGNYAVVIGGDLLSQLHKWEHWDKVANMVKVVAVGRPGFNTKPSIPNVEIYPVGISTVSSSEVRERIANHQSLDGYVPHEVKRYIVDNGLYK